MASVALDAGFGRLGRYDLMSREVIGELPSQTPAARQPSPGHST
jgi:hypothetical protein